MICDPSTPAETKYIVQTNKPVLISMVPPTMAMVKATSYHPLKKKRICSGKLDNMAQAALT